MAPKQSRKGRTSHQVSFPGLCKPKIFFFHVYTALLPVAQIFWCLPLLGTVYITVLTGLFLKERPIVILKILGRPSTYLEVNHKATGKPGGALGTP